MKGTLWNAFWCVSNLFAYTLDGNLVAPANMFMAGMCFAALVVSYVLKVKNERA